MADDDASEAADPSIKSKLDKIISLVRWPGADASPAKAAKDPKDEVPPEAGDMAERARRKYDGTLRWILGVFSTIGVLIFGSVPFVELRNVDPVPVYVGLLTAAVGLGVIIRATAKGLELQDASLGELAKSFETAPRKKVGQKHKFGWPLIPGPRRRANIRLKSIMQDSKEATAHLGPGIKSVEQLIIRLGQIESVSMNAYVDWDGGTTKEPPARPDDVPKIVDLADSVAAQTALADGVKKELETLAAALAELKKQIPEGKAPSDELAERISRAEKRYGETLAMLPNPSRLAKAATSNAWDELREFYNGHRKLVLQESLVAQIRGTFAVVLIWLMVGAALVAIGGLKYAYAVANPTSEGSTKNPVTVTLDTSSGAGKRFVDDACVDDAKDAKDVAVEGLLVTSRDADGLQNGPFSFTPLDGKCAGKTFDVDEGEGRYVGVAAAEGSTTNSSESAKTDEAAWVPVLVTILPNSPAWTNLNDCRKSQEDLSDVGALMIESSDPDAQQDGPFSVRLSEGSCAGKSVKIAEGEGKYTPRP